jgi:hypothetical protein
MAHLDSILTIIGALVPVFSALSSFVNHVVRTRQAAGESVPPMLMGAGAVLNLASVNVDKAVQMAKAVKAASAVAAPVAAAPEAPAAEQAPEAVKVE